MSGRRAVRTIGFGLGLGFCSALMSATSAFAQMALPTPKPMDAATLFKQQCATCHAITSSEPMRQGPPLDKVIGRHAGSVANFRYSPGFAKAEFAWDDAKLDAWMTNPQDVIPGTVMAYRQAKPEVRAAIISYLKELN